VREPCHGSANEQNTSNNEHAQEQSFLVLGSATDLNQEDSHSIDAVVEHCAYKKNLKDHGHGTLNELHDAVEAFAALAQVVHDPNVRTKVKSNGKTGYSVQQPGHVTGVPSVREVFTERHLSTSFLD
jgi:hypothetical protein